MPTYLQYLYEIVVYPLYNLHIFEGATSEGGACWTCLFFKSRYRQGYDNYDAPGPPKCYAGLLSIKTWRWFTSSLSSANAAMQIHTTVNNPQNRDLP